MPQRHTLCKGLFFTNIPGQVSPAASQIPIEYFVPLAKTVPASPEVKGPDGAATASGTAPAYALRDSGLASRRESFL
jgi:hypothetical protein